MSYVDGFVMVVPTKQLNAYRRMAKAACKVWMKHGATDYYECVGDDLKVKHGKGFPSITGLKKGESVVFAWIVYKSRDARKKINAKVMKDKAMDKMMKGPMPFDPKKMTYGGFKVIVKA
jgi:uncharacterized protein YbaA (DUF1428 family)